MGLRAAGAARDRERAALPAAPAQGAWAKYVFDRGLWQFAIRCDELAAAPPAVRAPLRRRHGPPGHRQPPDLRRPHGRQRERALRSGSADMEAEAPPPFYSFDADIGRLSVSTPRYGAAIVDRQHGAVPYGGIELARLFDRGRAGRRHRRPAAGRVRVVAAAARPPPRARHAGRAARRRGCTLDRSPRGRVARTGDSREPRRRAVRRAGGARPRRGRRRAR